MPVSPATGKDAYDRLVHAFRTHGFIPRRASQAAGVSEYVAGRAWKQGWPKRGLRAIREVLAEEQEAARAMQFAEEGRRAKAREDAARVRQREGDVVRVDFEVLAMATKGAFDLYKGLEAVAQHVQGEVLARLASEDSKARLTAAEGVRLLREAARLFCDLTEALVALQKAERLHFGEPTEILGVQVSEDAARFLRYVDEMTPEELEEALATGRLPDRLDARAFREGRVPSN